MEDLGENTTVLSSLRSLNNFISQRVEGGVGLDVSTSAQGSLQMQYQQSIQVSAVCRGGGSGRRHLSSGGAFSSSVWCHVSV